MIILDILQFQPEMIDTLYRFAKFQYECGNYSGAAEYLYFVRVLVRPIVENRKNLLLPVVVLSLAIAPSVIPGATEWQECIGCSVG